TQEKDRISVSIDGKPYTDFFLSADGNKPYVYPLRTASGVIVTRHFPMEKFSGETNDHLHHRGMFFSHGEINGYNFWATEPWDQKSEKGQHGSEEGGGSQGREKVRDHPDDFRRARSAGQDHHDGNANPYLLRSERNIYANDSYCDILSGSDRDCGADCDLQQEPDTSRTKARQGRAAGDRLAGQSRMDENQVRRLGWTRGGRRGGTDGHDSAQRLGSEILDRGAGDPCAEGQVSRP